MNFIANCALKSSFHPKPTSNILIHRNTKITVKNWLIIPAKHPNVIKEVKHLHAPNSQLLDKKKKRKTNVYSVQPPIQRIICFKLIISLHMLISALILKSSLKL